MILSKIRLVNVLNLNVQLATTTRHQELLKKNSNGQINGGLRCEATKMSNQRTPNVKKEPSRPFRSSHKNAAPKANKRPDQNDHNSNAGRGGNCPVPVPLPLPLPLSLSRQGQPKRGKQESILKHSPGPICAGAGPALRYPYFYPPRHTHQTYSSNTHPVHVGANLVAIRSQDCSHSSQFARFPVPVNNSHCKSFHRPDSVPSSTDTNTGTGTSGNNHREHPKETSGKKTDTGTGTGTIDLFRSWLKVDSKYRAARDDYKFTVMCYNVLAQDLITDHQYLYREHIPEALDWNKRWQNLLRHIKQIRPDILCMQEVQETHLDGYYSQLNTLGYAGIYKKRTGIRVDGCAIYYDVNKLDLVEYTTVEYFQDKTNVLNRDNVAIIARFCPKNKTQHFIVATTHLLYNPRRQDVRLAQVQMLLTEIDRLAYRKSDSGRVSYLPVIVTGDFNSKPDSAVYKFISEGFLRYELLEKKTLKERSDAIEDRMGKFLLPVHLKITDNCKHAALDLERKKRVLGKEEELQYVYIRHSERAGPGGQVNVEGPFSTGLLTHDFLFRSVYSHSIGDDVEATTFQDQWVTVDYIFYSGKRKGDQFSKDKLKLLSQYKLPTAGQLGSIKIPNLSAGSDHLSLVSKFCIRS